MNDQIKLSKEITQYIKYQRGDRRHTIGVMTAFKRNADSDKFYIGFSLKNKIDWAIYSDIDDPIIIRSLPFDKELALTAARNRAVKWAICPNKAHFKADKDGIIQARECIPPSIKDQFLLFLDRSRRYYKCSNNFFPEWIPQSIQSEFKSKIDKLYTKKEADKVRMIKSLQKQYDYHHNHRMIIEKKLNTLDTIQ